LANTEKEGPTESRRLFVAQGGTEQEQIAKGTPEGGNMGEKKCKKIRWDSCSLKFKRKTGGGSPIKNDCRGPCIRKKGNLIFPLKGKATRGARGLEKEKKSLRGDQKTIKKDPFDQRAKEGPMTGGMGLEKEGWEQIGKGTLDQKKKSSWKKPRLRKEQTVSRDEV